MSSKRVLLGLLVPVLGFAAMSPSAARAGNDEEAPVGNPSALTGAVVASVGDGSALWWNPAGVARVETDTADITASVFALRLHHIPDLVEVVGGDAYSELGIEFVVIPSALSYVRPINADLNIGVGLFSPGGQDLALRSDLEGAVPGASGELAFAVADLQTNYVGILGIGWTPTPGLNLGASMNVGYASSFATEQWGLRRTDASTDTLLIYADTVSTKIVDGGLVVGAQWDATDELSFGLSFASPTLAFFGFSRATTVLGAAELTATDLFLDGDLSDESNLDIAAEPYGPARFRSGASLAFPSWRIAVDVDVALPLSTPALNVERSLLVNARAGGAVTLAPDIELGFSLFTDLDPGSALVGEGQDFLGGTLGLHTENRLQLAGDEGDAIVFSSVLALRYAYGFGDVVGLRYDPSVADSLTTTTTGVSTHEILLHLGSSVSF